MTITIFLCGDVMIGRGIDQVLSHPSAPRIYEPYITDARGYVELAERAFGPIPKPVAFDYVWGDALDELERFAPAARLINLETAVTESDEYWPQKGINYRVTPANAAVLSSAGINVASLANNHVLDWGYRGLEETLDTISKMKISIAGAGRNKETAEAPAILETEHDARIIVFGFAAKTSGVPDTWAAEEDRPGVNLLPDLLPSTIRAISERVQRMKRPRDIIVASIHWGENWGYEISAEEERFAHGLIDESGVDIIHGHSSHHAKRIEVYRQKLILYGCGDFLTDYEGIGGREYYRGDLGLMYFPTINPGSGKLLSMAMTPTTIRRFRIIRASPGDAEWLARVLNREGEAVHVRVRTDAQGRLLLNWNE